MNYRDDSQVGNVKFLWELGRHQHLVPLAAAYAVTGESIYQDTVVAQIEEWIKLNNFDRGIHWCTALEVALRLLSWAVIHSFFFLQGQSKGLFSVVRDPEALGKSIYQHAWFVAHFLSRYSSANNHLIGELTGLWTGCQVFDLGRDGDKWGDQAQRELEIQAKKQVFPDGVNREQATYYHLWVLDYFLFASLVGLRTGKPFSTDFEKTIDSMAAFLDAITPRGGVPPQIGDADDGFVTRFGARWPEKPYEDVLNAVTVTKRKQCPQDISQKSFWYGIMAGVDCQSLPKEERNIKIGYPTAFPEGGYAVLGDDLVHLIFDAGSLGYPSIAAHGHADALSFCLAVNGEWWLVDPGTYAYHSQLEWRNYFRGTAAHNTLTVDGLDQSQIGGTFLWIRHAPVQFEGCGITENDGQWAAGSHRGYAKIAHRRKIEYRKRAEEIHILDTVTGKGHHELTQNFHFAPDIEIKCNIDNVWVATKGQSLFTLAITGQAGWSWQVLRGSTEPISGWYSPNLGKKQATVTLRGIWSGELPVNVKTVIRIHHVS
ncbi:MAG: alginate lyase family protein [Desulfocapsaceae bacterium]|nr:alginate lyase family protein [Desulfocapsaceae bacterium]